MFIKRSIWENSIKEKLELQHQLDDARKDREYLKNIIFSGIEGYIDLVYVEPEPAPVSADVYAESKVHTKAEGPYVEQHINFQTVSLSEIEPLNELLENVQSSFSEKLMEIIRERNLDEVDVYKKAELDRRHFSKIRSDSHYRPTKDTVVMLCLSMESDFDEAQDLLQRAGFSLSHSNKKDIISEYFLKQKIYDVLFYKEILYEHSCLK